MKYVTTTYQLKPNGDIDIRPPMKQSREDPDWRLLSEHVELVPMQGGVALIQVVTWGQDT